MIDEIALQPFAVSGNGSPAPCARNTFNDIFDYNKYASPASGVCDIDGNAIPDLAGYTVAITVANTALSPISAANAARIAVAVSHGSETMTFVAWRTWYACDPTQTACPP